MRTAESKLYLMIFDFLDNASKYNMPYSMHRLFKLRDYRPGKLVLASSERLAAEDGL